MIILNYLNKNNYPLSNKGFEIFKLAIIKVYPLTENWVKNDNYFILLLDLPDQDCQAILDWAVKYSKLWEFS